MGSEQNPNQNQNQGLHTDRGMPENVAGRRVSCGGERATVRYLGPVPPTEGVWLGVEWDDPERGKHDGRHEGVHYFTCRQPKGGSFVRPSKVSFGQDFLSAVNQLYQIDREEVHREDSTVWDRVRETDFESLPSLLLGSNEVSGPGEEGAIKTTTPNVRWLDLSGNLLSCWEDVSSITSQLEHLEGLMLSNNRLTMPSDVSLHSSSFLNLKVLALNKCQLTWAQVLQCAPMWPQLEEFSLDENNITELQRPEGLLQSVKILDLSNNPLQQDTLLCLTALTRLEQLKLSRTGLSHIRFDDTEPGGETSMFPALKILYLDHNNISEWSVINELSKLVAMVQLGCRGNPLKSADGNPKTANQILIAKLPRLHTLNRCIVEPEDRRGAELDYLKLFGEEWLKAGANEAEGQVNRAFSCLHPTYLKLIEKYGAPEEGELKKPQPFALKNQLLKILFVFPDDADRKPIEKKLPASMVLQKVKGLLYRLLKIPAADLRLSYSSPKMLGTEFEMDSDLKTLQFYSIDDGDQLIVRWA